MGLFCVRLKSMAGTVSRRRKREADDHTQRLHDASLVHRMRQGGRSYVDIAAALRITPHKVTALHREHLDYLRELEALGSADANRTVQDHRYEALLATVWDQAMAGDMAAVRECRAILDSITAREVKVTALITKDGDDGRRTTLVAEGATAAYIQALREGQGEHQ